MTEKRGAPEHTQTAAAGTSGPTLRVRSATLEVISGPDRGRRASVEQPTFVVGSGGGADLRLSDGMVSREHLRLSLEASGVRVRDEGSKNGTWLGGARLLDALLTADAELALGSTRIALRLSQGPLSLPLSAAASFGDAVGVSGPMRHLFAVLERAAATGVTVLLEGESGVGKEVLARALHGRSPRSAGPFVAVDCGAIPETLIEAELFGHEKGAFTGATGARSGVFEQAQGGTLFLDEIGELPLSMQPKLLRALDQREIRPLGARAARKVDARIIAATNRRLAEAAHRGEFRADLFYRLSVARVTVPPLRDRRDDIVPIATAFLRVALSDPRSELPADLAAMLTSYAWPGNVRELRNVIDRYALLGVRDARGLFDAQPTGPADPSLALLPYHEARRRALDGFEREYLPAVLARAGGVVARAAELAQVARPSFYRMLERLRGPQPDDE